MTQLALVGLLAGVDTEMFRQGTRVRKGFLAQTTPTEETGSQTRVSSMREEALGLAVISHVEKGRSL